jgi:hypothetical protein
MDRFNDCVRCRGQEAIDHVRAGDGLRLGATIAFRVKIECMHSPMFGSIDGNNANLGDVLFGHQISDSGLDIPLSEDTPIVTETIDDKIHFMIVTRGLDY